MEFIAIDFETANAHRSSVCALGTVVFRKGKIKEEKYWLIRPSEFYFDPMNVSIHGIIEEDVEDKPEFGECWEEIKPYFEGQVIIAHNASFDISVLRKVLDVYGISYPELTYFCTRVIAKKIWPKLLNYRLDTVSDYLSIDFRHHSADEDARACGVIAIEALRACKVSSLDSLVANLDLRAGQLGPNGYKPCGQRKRGLRVEDIVSTSDTFDPFHQFFSKIVVFTGTLSSMTRRVAMQKVVDCGGTCSKSISAGTNYLILGEQDFTKLRGNKKSSKMKKAEVLISQGVELEVIPESDFLRLL